MNTIVFMILAAFLAAGVTAYKYFHWRSYKNTYNRRQPLKLVFSRMDIDGATSREKSTFMRNSNFISAGVAILLLLTLLLTFLQWVVSA